MISSPLNAVLSTILGLKIFVSGILFVAPPIKNDNNELFLSSSSSSSPHEEDDDGFESFLKLLQDKGMSFLTLVEAGALYLLWTVVKDTKSREEFLEKVFRSWSQHEDRVRSFGKVFRLMGHSCLGLHKVSLSELEMHLNKQRKVVVIYEQKEIGICFLDLKKIIKDKEVFIDQNENEFSIKEIDHDLLFDILVFLDKNNDDDFPIEPIETSIEDLEQYLK